jgi:hypothetical protein
MERNPDHGKFVKPEGYTDIGWQMNDNVEAYKKCRDLGHNDYRAGHRRKYDNSLYRYRATDIITICDTCKIIWHTDMSD